MHDQANPSSYHSFPGPVWASAAFEYRMGPRKNSFLDFINICFKFIFDDLTKTHGRIQEGGDWADRHP